MSTPDSTITNSTSSVTSKSFSKLPRAPNGTVILNPPAYNEKINQLQNITINENNDDEADIDVDPNPFEASNVIETQQNIPESPKSKSTHIPSPKSKTNVNSFEDPACKSQTKLPPSPLKSAMRPTVSGSSTPQSTSSKPPVNFNVPEIISDNPHSSTPPVEQQVAYTRAPSFTVISQQGILPGSRQSISETPPPITKTDNIIINDNSNNDANINSTKNKNNDNINSNPTGPGSNPVSPVNKQNVNDAHRPETHFFKPEKQITAIQTEIMTEDYDISNIPYRKSIVDKKYDNPVYRDRAHTSSKNAPPLPVRKHEDLVQKVEQNKLHPVIEQKIKQEDEQKKLVPTRNAPHIPHKHALASSTNPTLKPIISTTLHVRIYVCGGQNLLGKNETLQTLNTMECFDTQTRVWEKLLPMQCERSYACTVSLGGKVYVLGGQNHKEKLYGNSEVYDPVRQVWIDFMPDMNFKRSQFTATAYSSRYIIVIGGCTNGLFLGLTETNSVELYDLTKNEWKLLAPMKHKRRGHTASLLGDKIYVFGGTNKTLDGSSLNATEIYDIKLNKWCDGPAMLEKRVGCSSAALYERLYVFGGSDNKNCERLEPKSGKWKMIADLDIDRTWACTAIVGQRIYVIGGSSGAYHHYNTALSYEPTTDTFFHLPAHMNDKRSAACCVGILHRL